MKSPFKFLDAYELKDKDVFFGRGEETEALYNMVFKTPLLLVYGLSGTGKTSLIQCGLASRFTGPNWFPFFIRRGEDINAAIRKTLEPVLPKGVPWQEKLTGNVGLLFRHYLRPVYLIFDQLEELFILGNRDEQLEFARAIRELTEAELPCKVIFVMREEFIGQLYYLEKEIPGIYDFRLRVEPMGFKKVQEVIAGSFDHFRIALEDQEQNIERIYQNISAGKSGVQLPYLQVYLDMLWRENLPVSPAGKNGQQVVLTTAGIEAFGAIENVLARFLREQESVLLAAVEERYPEAPANSIRQILDAFVTEEGTKRPVHFSREGEALVPEARVALLLSGLPAPALAFILDHLQNARLLRERDDALELAHDALAALIDRERSAEQRKVNEVKTRLQSALREYQLSNGTEYPNRKLLLDTQELLEQLRLSPELQAFYAASQTEAGRRDAAEREEGERRARQEEIALRAEEEARLRRIAEKARRRASIRAVLATLMAVVAIAAGIFAFYQKEQAEAQRDRARRNERRANDKTEEANHNLELAKQNAAALATQKSIADTLRSVAEKNARKAEAQSRLAKKSEQKTREALSDLEVEKAEKERLQFSAKVDYVESFLNVGNCALARAALQDLEKIARNNPGDPDIRRSMEDLRKRVEACMQ